MPMRIADSRIRSFVTAQQASTQPRITDANVLDLLAAVGDGSRRTADAVRAELTKPGTTRAQQLALAKSGLTSSEKSDIGQLLDKSGFAMDAGAKNFLEALIDRAPLQESFGPLTIVGDQRNGIAGIAKPGEVIEAINLSTAPSGRLHLVDTMVVGTADATGKFLGTMPDVREGDMIRLRARAADGSTSDWITIQAKGVEARDTRNAVVNLERMDLSVANGRIAVTHNTGRPLSEPGASIRFVNVRTGEKVDVVATDKGSLPAGTTLPGRAGDEFRVSVSDGRNNVNHATVTGTLRVPGSTGGSNGVDLADPAMHKDEMNADGTPKFKLERFTGPLFLNEPTPGDVRQGAIGNCYFPAALASVAHTSPQVIKDMIKKNEDGTYTVRFYENGNRSRPVNIKVDGDLYVRSWGGPIYGGSLGGSTSKESMELWYPLIEKAYAQWKGSYDAIGNGGSSGRVMSEVLGRGQGYEWVSAGSEQRLFDRIKRDIDRGVPVAAGTHGSDQASVYTNTGVYANHAYSVLGVEEKNGEKFVKLRNPWGQSEYGNDGKNDGFFSLPMKEFTKLYSSLYVLN
jgi:hypothetical protein